MYMCMYMSMYMCMCMYVCVCVSLSLSLYIYIYIYIYIAEHRFATFARADAATSRRESLQRGACSGFNLV